MYYQALTWWVWDACGFCEPDEGLESTLFTKLLGHQGADLAFWLEDVHFQV